MSDNQLAEPAIGIGHNQPPLEALIAEELSPLRSRADQLVEVAATAVIVDDISAAKVIDLAGLLAGLEKEINTKREATKRPYLDACRAIDAAYSGALQPLIVCRQGTDGRGGLKAMLTAYNHKREGEARVAREAAEAEQRQREEAAEAAKARARQTANVGDALASLKAQEEADAARRRAEAIRPEPVRAQLGSLGARREIAFDVTDLRKLLGWLIKQPGISAVLTTEVRKIVGSYLRQVGVDAVQRGIEIPGLRAWIDTQAAIRR